MQLPEDKLEQVKRIQEETNATVFQLGEVEVALINLKEQKAQLQEKYKQLRAENTQLTMALAEEFGDGSIDLETGTFTPAT